MKPPSDRHRREATFGEAPCPLSALLLYENAPCAIRAKHLFDCVVDHVNLIVSFRLSLCRFDLLSSAASEGAEPDSLLDQDILLLAAWGHQDLPPCVWDWLDRWLARDPVQPRALVVSLDEKARHFPIAQQTQYFLQAAAYRAGVEVFSHFGETNGSELDSAIADIRYRADTTSSLLDQTLHRRSSGEFRFWGIND